MTRAALAKLFILVILAFIICLPEFFSLNRVSKVSFHCQPYRPCERGNQKKTADGDGEMNRKDMCDPSKTTEHEKWKQACRGKNKSNTTKDPVYRRFICQTNKEMAELHSNVSSSALKVYLEVSVEFQLNNTETVNLTFYSRSNYSSLHLHPPEEEEEVDKKKAGDDGQKEAFYCCLPILHTSRSANQSLCLLWLTNQAVLTSTAKEKLPWKRPQRDEWQCIFRVLWLALLCMVLLAVVTTVIGQIYWQKRSCNPTVYPVDFNVTTQQLNGGVNHREITPTVGTIPHIYKSWTWSELSPIQESKTQEDIETLLDGNVDNCYAANLHHRGHPSTSGITEE